MLQVLATYWRFGLFWILAFLGFVIGGLLENIIGTVTIPVQGLIIGAISNANLGLPLSRVRGHLAQGDPSAAVAVLESFRQQAETRGWQDERLKVMVQQAAALHAITIQASGLKDGAVQVLDGTSSFTEPGSLTQKFNDEVAPMTQLRSEATKYGIVPDDSSDLPSALPEGGRDGESLVELLSEREMEVLQLIAQGLSNDEISERLFLALSTVKGHNQLIFGKLHVQRRTEAVARARELGLF
jgi:LuxR family maltose regulon positive regulatory protein